MPLPIEVKFYSNVKPLIATNIAFGFLFAIVPTLILKGWIWMVVGCGIMILGTLVLLGARKIWPVHAGPHGLRTYDGIGIYSDLPWDEVAAVTAAAGYYWIRTQSGRTLCVPTYLEQMTEFKAYVHRHAPEDNPLRLAM